MTSEWCRDPLNEAIEKYGKPEIINTDQGAQFTSELYTTYVEKLKTVHLSMDGKDARWTISSSKGFCAV